AAAPSTNRAPAGPPDRCSILGECVRSSRTPGGFCPQKNVSQERISSEKSCLVGRPGNAPPGPTVTPEPAEVGEQETSTDREADRGACRRRVCSGPQCGSAGWR